MCPIQYSCASCLPNENGMTNYTLSSCTNDSKKQMHLLVRQMDIWFSWAFLQTGGGHRYKQT